jgi:hypothetical protein
VLAVAQRSGQQLGWVIPNRSTLTTRLHQTWRVPWVGRLAAELFAWSDEFLFFGGERIVYVQTIFTLLAQALQQTATPGKYFGAQIALFTNNLYPTRTNLLSDFTIADFGGLTNLQALVWAAPFLNSNQQAEVLGALITWLTTSSTGLPVTVYGYLIVDSAGTDLLLAERFANPVAFNASGVSFSLIPRLVYDT